MVTAETSIDCINFIAKREVKHVKRLMVEYSKPSMASQNSGSAIPCKL